MSERNAVGARKGRTTRDLDSSGPHQQLSEKVAHRIREEIMAGALRPGVLRTERLAEDLGVSPTPVREALMILQTEGAVRWEPRRGFRLNPMTARDVKDLYSVQAYIAGELAARAAAALSGEDLDRLEAIQSELEEAAGVGNVELVDELNHEIHRTINTASSSERMANLLRQTVQYVPLRFFGQIDGWAEASAHDHSAIFTALRRRKKAATRKAMTEHIEHIGSLLLAHLKSQGVLQEGE